MEHAVKNFNFLTEHKAIICFSAVDWQFLKQRVHHLMAGFARHGWKVLFIENTGVRVPHWGDLPRMGQRLKSVLIKNVEKNNSFENLEVLSPLVPPFPYNQAAVRYNQWFFTQQVGKFLKRCRLRPEEVVFWTYLATPVVVNLASSFSWGQVVYDLVSDPKEVESHIAPYERELLQKADVVFFASATLMEQYKKQTKNPVLFRDGFNVELLKVEAEIPTEVAELPKPHLLYIGGINRKFWVEALEMLGKQIPNATLILLGPIDRAEITLPHLPNLYWFQPCKRYTDLAGFLKTADVALIPYHPDPYAGAMHPAKLNEYLVFGLPVVATATPELKLLARQWPEKTLYLAETAEEFPQVVIKAIKEDSAEKREYRQKSTKENRWDNRVQELFTIFNKRW